MPQARIRGGCELLGCPLLLAASDSASDLGKVFRPRNPTSQLLQLCIHMSDVEIQGAFRGGVHVRRPLHRLGVVPGTLLLVLSLRSPLSCGTHTSLRVWGMSAGRERCTPTHLHSATWYDALGISLLLAEPTCAFSV